MNICYMVLCWFVLYKDYLLLLRASINGDCLFTEKIQHIIVIYLYFNAVYMKQ